MKKAWIFLSVFFVGIALIILEFAVLKYDGTAGYLLTLAGVFMVIGGAVGACFYSKNARTVFGNLIRAVLDLI